MLLLPGARILKLAGWNMATSGIWSSFSQGKKIKVEEKTSMGVAENLNGSVNNVRGEKDRSIHERKGRYVCLDEKQLKGCWERNCAKAKLFEGVGVEWAEVEKKEKEGYAILVSPTSMDLSGWIWIVL